VIFELEFKAKTLFEVGILEKKIDKLLSEAPQQKVFRSD